MPNRCTQCGNELKANSKKAQLRKVERREENMVKTSQFAKAIARLESVGNQAGVNAIRFFAHQVGAPINEDFIRRSIGAANTHCGNGFKAKSKKAELQKLPRGKENIVRTGQFENTIALFASLGDEVGASAIRDFAHQVDAPINRDVIKRSIKYRRMWLVK